MVQVNQLIQTNLPLTTRIQQSHRIVIHRSLLIQVTRLAILVIHLLIQARGQTIQHNQALPKDLNLLNLLSSPQINHQTSLRILLRINHLINHQLSQTLITLLSHLHQQGLLTHPISLQLIRQPTLLVVPQGIRLAAIPLEAIHLEAIHLEAIHQVLIHLQILQPILRVAILLVAILQPATHLLILQVVIPHPIHLLELCLTNLQRLLQPMTQQSHRHKNQLNPQQSPPLSQPSLQLKNRPNLPQSPQPSQRNLPRRSHLRTRNHPRSRQT